MGVLGGDDQLLTFCCLNLVAVCELLFRIAFANMGQVRIIFKQIVSHQISDYTNRCLT